LDSMGRPIKQKPTVDATLGVPAVREAVLQMLRQLNTRAGNGIGVLAVCPNITGTFAYESERDVVFMAAMWSLVRDGIIVPGAPAGMSSNNYVTSDLLGFSTFTVTPFGRQLLDNTNVVHPYEADAYMRDARKRLDAADDVIYTYLAEARKSFADGNHLSAIVMLGVSTEMLMKWLIDRFIAHVPEAKRANFEKTRGELWTRTDKLFDSYRPRARTRRQCHTVHRQLPLAAPHRW
jgi:hypothetical protein